LWYIVSDKMYNFIQNLNMIYLLLFFIDKNRDFGKNVSSNHFLQLVLTSTENTFRSFFNLRRGQAICLPIYEK